MGNVVIHRQDAYWEIGLEALDFKNYVAVNYSMIQRYGLHAAVLIGELASEARYWKNEGQLKEGWFFSTVENIEQHTGLNSYYQREAMKVLQDAGLVEVAYKGLPRKRYIRVNPMRVIEEMSEETAGQRQCFTEPTTSDSQSQPPVEHTVDDNNSKEQLKPTRKKERESFDSIIDGFTDDDGLREALREFLKFRKAKGKGFTNRALRLNLTKLSKLSNDPETQTAIVYQTIERGWSGFFPLKDDARRSDNNQGSDDGIPEYLRAYDF